MDYDDINKIGKIKEFDKEFGVGKIISVDDVYLFIINDTSGAINVGDLVKFRGETINDEKRAFFVDKINNDYVIKNKINKSKIYKNKK